MDTFTNPVMKEKISKKKLVLIGAGHSHLYVLKKLITSPLKGYNIFLITNHPFSTYSGMIPGAIAGQYSDYTLDIRPLAHLAGVTFIHAEAKSINPVTQHIELSKGYPPIKYDMCSVNIGSTVSVDIPRDHSPLIPTRPINSFIPMLEKMISKINPKDEVKLTIVGSGIAGIELAFCTQEKLKKICSKKLTVNIIDKSPNPFQNPQFTKILKKEFKDRNIQLFTGYKPESIKNNTLFLKKQTPSLKKDTLAEPENKAHIELQNTKNFINSDDSTMPFDILIWATGATPPDLLLNSNLPKDKQGFASVNAFLQSIDYENLFFSGDCCHFERSLPKAGVYAVRQGPVLFENLKRMATEKPLRPFKPQKDFLQLVNLGNGKAIAQKFGFAGKSSIFWKLKNSIDKKFISEFQVLNTKAQLTDKFKTMSLQTMDMSCGGCASKLSAQSLYKVLQNTKKEDVAISPLNENLLSNPHLKEPTRKLSLVSNIDGFKPFHKDLFLVAQVATLNTLSDFWAKSLTPVQGLASIHLEEFQVSELSWIMEGIKNIFSQHSVHFAGGHTTVGLETLLNISVNGVMESSQKWMSLDNIKSGLDLILTKPLGTGVLLYLDMRGHLPSHWATPLKESLLLPNKTASDIALQYDVPTATDITGFGLAGHLLEMIENKDLSIEMNFENLPLLDGADISLKRGYRSTFHPHNLHFKKQIQTHRKDIDILFDPQTSGGLVLAAEPDQTQNILKDLIDGGHRAKVIGITKPYENSKIIVV